MGNTACGAKRRQALANRRLGAAAAADSNIAASSQYSDTSGQYSSGYGGGGGGGYVYAMMCPEGIDQDIALAATAAALAVGIYVVYRQVKYYNISLLDKAPNYIVGCIIQKISSTLQDCLKCKKFIYHIFFYKHITSYFI